MTLISNRWLVLVLALLFVQCESSPSSAKTVESTSGWTQKEDHYPTGERSRLYWLKDGKKDSIMIMFERNGDKMGELRFKNDLQEGYTYYFYPNGKMKEKQFFINGKREGIFTVWHENGTVQSEITFEKDKMNGVFKKWNPESKLITECIFRNDTLQQVIK